MLKGEEVSGWVRRCVEGRLEVYREMMDVHACTFRYVTSKITFRSLLQENTNVMDGCVPRATYRPPSILRLRPRRASPCVTCHVSHVTFKHADRARSELRKLTAGFW